MKRNIVIAVLGASAFVLLCGFGHWGRPSPERAKRFVDMHIDDTLEDLKATPAQGQKIHAVVDGLYPDATQLFLDHQKSRAEMTELLAQDKVDANRVHALVDQRIDAFRSFAHKVVDGVISAHDVLNPAQRAQLADRARERQQE